MSRNRRADTDSVLGKRPSKRSTTIRKEWSMRKVAMAVTMVAVLALVGIVRAEEATPDATIQLKAGSIAAGVGVSWGSGTLTYKGKSHPISVNGLTAVAARADYRQGTVASAWQRKRTAPFVSRVDCHVQKPRR